MSATDEIDYLAKIVEDDVAALEAALKKHLKTDVNPNGVLTNDLSKYADCYKMNRKKLKQLLSKEVDAWNSNLQSVKASMDAHLLGLQKLIESQQSALEEHVFLFDRKGPIVP